MSANPTNSGLLTPEREAPGNATGIAAATTAIDRAPGTIPAHCFETVFGRTPADSADNLLALELAQLQSQDEYLADRFADISTDDSKLTQRRFIDRLVSRYPVSEPLRGALLAHYALIRDTSQRLPALADPKKILLEPHLRTSAHPGKRRLRGYAVDPWASGNLSTRFVNETVYSIQWEPGLRPGPVGEYVEVIDIDHASGGFYAPVDLNDSCLLAQDGLAPQEGEPKFHQQMVYAVAMSTIESFERALGRYVQWAPRMNAQIDKTYVRRLRIYPHALREQNAYYDPSRKALLFGYFQAGNTIPGQIYPGGMVFTCLSQGIVAHEISHAILDGVHRSLLTPSNVDALAFHEAFSDIVALLQNFSTPQLLRYEIARTRGDVRAEGGLGQLAVQFGLATGQRGALRSAIGDYDQKTGHWTVNEPDPSALENSHEPHARGAILVAAVFDALISIYESRSADLLRIATEGTGILRDGALHPDVVKRLAAELEKSAKHLLKMCIRALDYCPPVDLDFGDYLRALITADCELMPEDNQGYRLAVVEAFRRRGIYPKTLKNLSVEQLRWDQPRNAVNALAAPMFKSVLSEIYAEYAGLCAPRYGRPNVPGVVEMDDICPEDGIRAEQFKLLRKSRGKLHEVLYSRLGYLSDDQRERISEDTGLDLRPGYSSFEVRSIQMTSKVDEMEQVQPRVLVSLIQRQRICSSADQSNPENTFLFHGGCTLVIDPVTGHVDYVIRKRTNSMNRQNTERAYRAAMRSDPCGTYFGPPSPGQALASLHRGTQE